jgi:hypothetical protein
VVAAVLSLVCQPLPWKFWVIMSALGGIAAGWVTHYHATKVKPTNKNPRPQ